MLAADSSSLWNRTVDATHIPNCDGKCYNIEMILASCLFSALGRWVCLTCAYLAPTGELFNIARIEIICLCCSNHAPSDKPPHQVVYFCSFLSYICWPQDHHYIGSKDADATNPEIPPTLIVFCPDSHLWALDAVSVVQSAVNGCQTITKIGLSKFDNPMCVFIYKYYMLFSLEPIRPLVFWFNITPGQEAISPKIWSCKPFLSDSCQTWSCRRFKKRWA